MIDVIFISPGNTSTSYQDLSINYTTIEPPTWALLLAESCRSKNIKPAIIDINAEGLTDEQVYQRVIELSPRLVVFVVYGQNVNAGTASMSGAIKTSSFLKDKGIKPPISYIGSYAQALPKKCLEDEPSIDFVFTNEGVYSLINILSRKEIHLNNLSLTKGIAWRKGRDVIINPSEAIVPQNRMDIDLPGYAWDLLPYKETPLDLYRAPMWHAEYEESKRSPYAAIQTSLGCQFKCSFCMINILNRSDEREIGVASNYNTMRFWSPEFIIKEFDKLVSMGVTTIKITDEMFLLNKKYYIPLCKLLAEREYSSELLMWAYSRIDTVRDPKTLDLLKSAGIMWLALGIESADKTVRLEVSKGKFEDVDIAEVVEQVHDSGINVMANYIFGLPGDTQESMRKTMDLSKELCTMGWNAYGAMPLPGSELYYNAIMNDEEVPERYEQYSFYGYDTLPQPNENLSSAEILRFRDEAFVEYHSDDTYLNNIEKSFGKEAKESIIKLLEVTLSRRILE